MLVAAAAIVVGGVTLAQNVHPTSGNGSATTAEDAPRADSMSGGTTGDTGNGRDTTPSTKHPGPLAVTEGTIVVHPRHFSRDALEGRRFAAASDTAETDAACIDLAKHTRVVPATYQNAPAALVYRRPEGSSQVVDLFVCGSSRPVRTTTLPAP
jgi:hypothetical protein